MKNILITFISIFIYHNIACQSLITDCKKKINVSSKTDTVSYTIKHLYSLNMLLCDSQKVIFIPKPFYLPFNQIDTANFPPSDLNVSQRGDTTIYKCTRGYVELAFNGDNKLDYLEVDLYPMKTYSLIIEYKNQRIFRICTNKTWYEYHYKDNHILKVDKVKVKKCGTTKMINSYNIKYIISG